jgi:hypothetical protein
MDELVCEATSEADGCAAANLHRNGGITAVVTSLSKESRKERRFMVHVVCSTNRQSSPTLLYSNPAEDSQRKSSIN